MSLFRDSDSTHIRASHKRAWHRNWLSMPWRRDHRSPWQILRTSNDSALSFCPTKGPACIRALYCMATEHWNSDQPSRCASPTKVFPQPRSTEKGQLLDTRLQREDNVLTLPIAARAQRHLQLYRLSSPATAAMSTFLVNTVSANQSQACNYYCTTDSCGNSDCR
jgi:hypothetical protein